MQAVRRPRASGKSHARAVQVSTQLLTHCCPCSALQRPQRTRGIGVCYRQPFYRYSCMHHTHLIGNPSLPTCATARRGRATRPHPRQSTTTLSSVRSCTAPGSTKLCCPCVGRVLIIANYGGSQGFDNDGELWSSLSPSLPLVDSSLSPAAPLLILLTHAFALLSPLPQTAPAGTASMTTLSTVKA